MREIGQIGLQLRDHRQVEPEPGAQLAHGFFGGRSRLARQHVGRVTRHQLQQEEVQHDERQRGWDGGERVAFQHLQNTLRRGHQPFGARRRAVSGRIVRAWRLRGGLSTVKTSRR